MFEGMNTADIKKNYRHQADQACFDHKVALEHTTKATAKGQLAHTIFCTYPKTNDSLSASGSSPHLST